MGFFLYLLVNATLFIRPMEIVPELEGINIYQYLILACLLFSIPEIFDFFTYRRLDFQPIVLCVFLIQAAVLLHPMVHFRAGEFVFKATTFFKVLIYFLLTVSLLSTPRRLKIFLYCLPFYCLVLTTVTVLQYHDILQLPTLQPLPDSERDRVTGEIIVFERLQGSGIFQDPNELCVMLATALPLVFYILVRANFLLRFLLGGTILLCGYGIYLTKSRGGFLAMLAGMAAFSWARFGWKKTLALGALGLPLLLVVYGGRQTQISTSTGTAQTRVQLWSDWMMKFRYSPFVGEGMSFEDPEKAKEKIGPRPLEHLAHNSYLQGFADLGFLGGAAFLGAFWLGWTTLRDHNADRTRILDPEMCRLQPYLFGAFTAYAVGLLSLSLNYVVPTYLFLGLAAAFPRLAPSWPPVPPRRAGVALAMLIGALSVGYLAALYVFVRLFRF